MHLRKTIARLGVAGLVAIAPAVVSASPVTYDYTGGSITLTATISTLGGSSTIVDPTTIPLTGNFATFDSTAGALTNFEFSTTGSTTIALTGPLTGESITLSNMVATPGPGYTSTTTNFAAGVYSFNASPVNGQGQYALSGSIWTVGTTNFNGNSTGLTGQLQTSGDQFALNGITIATKTIGSGPTMETVTLKADVDFTGVEAVPVPAAVWLLGSGLGLMGLPFLRRRRAA